MGTWFFLKNALSDKNIGALVPSSHFVVKNILRRLPKNPQTILEYGPGDGVITKKLLKQLGSTARLISIEKNSIFSKMLRESIQDSRFTVINNDVIEATHQPPGGIEQFEVVVSGIPFSFLPAGIRENIIKRTYQLLAPGGMFVVYQVTPLVYPILKKYFNQVRLAIELRNLPPYFIMVAKKD